jgi:histone-lysine N-methyltransferase SETMAR
VILKHDNARPHTANLTKAAIQELDWEILPHPTYSPDLEQSEYHLFCSLSINLRGVSFNNDAELQNWLDEFSTAKPADFFKREIGNLPERWEAVVSNGGEYIID